MVSFDHPKQMFKLMDKKVQNCMLILAQFMLFWSYMYPLVCNCALILQPKQQGGMLSSFQGGLGCKNTTYYI